LVVLTTCADLRGPTALPPRRMDTGLVDGNPRGPMCQLGCNDSDPNPDSIGIFLGNDIDPDFCIDGGWTDADADDLADYCENLISYAFRPELRYSSWHDDVRGEPYWVARPDSSGQVVVGYLLSYYRDLGSVQWGCSPPTGHESWGCHNGDSESIWLTISYHPGSKHWVLQSARYSHHTDWNISTFDATRGYASVEYPETPGGGYPRAWVAEQKHANYFHERDCNSWTDYFGADDCSDDDTSARVDWSAYWNIGSESNPFINQVTSRDSSYEYFGGRRTECYWTEKSFRGWVPDSIGGGEAASYLSKLIYWGFATTGVSGCQ